MAQLQHAFASAKSDDPDGSLVNPSDWNANHEGLVVVRKAARETVNNSTTLQDDDDLLFAIAANEEWAFELFLISNGPAAGDIKFAITVPSGATLIWASLGIASTATDLLSPGLGTVIQTSGASGTFGELGGATWVLTRIYGTVVNGANAGNLQLQWAQNTANGTDTHVEVNSWLKASRIA